MTHTPALTSTGVLAAMWSVSVAMSAVRELTEQLFIPRNVRIVYSTLSIHCPHVICFTLVKGTPSRVQAQTEAPVR